MKLALPILFLALATMLPAQELDRGGVFRVLVVGDSWAEFMWDDRSLRNVFAEMGHGDILEKGDVTAISGSTAAQWVDPGMLQLITDELTANPTIELVQLTMGGNDFLAGQSEGGWFVGMPQEDLDALFDQIAGDIQTVIDHILGLDPDLKIVLSLYDYPNFVESLSGLGAFFCVPLWEDMGEPTPLQLNQIQTEFSDRVALLVAGQTEVFTVSHLGLMHFYFGYPSMGIDPGDLLPPGDLNLPSPPQAMRFINSDCIHLNSGGHEHVARNLFDQFYSLFFCISEIQFFQSLVNWPFQNTVIELADGVNQACESLP